MADNNDPGVASIFAVHGVAVQKDDFSGEISNVQGISVEQDPGVASVFAVHGYTLQKDQFTGEISNVQGVSVEQDAGAASIFAAHGFVVEKTPPSVQVSQLRGLIAQKSLAKVNVSQLRVLAAQNADGTVPLPIGVTPLDNFKTMVGRKTSVVPDWATLTIGLPRVDPVSGGAATLVKISPTPDSIYRTAVDVSYTRRSIALLAALKIMPGSVANADEFVDAVRTRGYLITIDDIDVAKSTFTTLQIIAHANVGSYFFYKSSLVIGDATPLSKQFTVTDANGFEPVLPPPLIDTVFASDTLENVWSTLPASTTGEDALFTSIVAQNTAGHLASDFLLGAVEALTGDSAYNSRVNLSAVEGSGLRGDMWLRFNRLPLSGLSSTLTNIGRGDATTVHDLIPVINAATGLLLTTQDLVDGSVDPLAVSVALTANASSLFFIPGAQVNLTAPAFADLFKTDYVNWS